MQTPTCTCVKSEAPHFLAEVNLNCAGDDVLKKKMTGRYFSPGSVGGASALLLLRNTHVGGRCSDAIERHEQVWKCPPRRCR